jgi:hypothetical protein
MPKRIAFVAVLIVAMILSAVPAMAQQPNQPAAPAAASDSEPNTTGAPRPGTESATESALGGTNYWAVISRAGGTNRSRGRVSSARLAVGQYEVIFLDNVRNCAYTATVGDIDAVGTEITGEITTVGRVTDVRGVFVTTHNSAGVASDRSFHLLVSC